MSLIKYIYVALSGIILPLAFEPYNLYILSFLSIAILFYIWSKSTLRDSFFVGYLFGLFYFGVGISWVHISINIFGETGLVFSIFLAFLLIAFISLYPALCGYIALRFFKDKLIIALPFIWVITEWLRGWLFSGFSWLNLGTSQTNSWYFNYAPILGDYGVSLLICLTASCLILLLNRSLKKKIIGLVVVVSLNVMAFYLENIQWTKATGKTLDVALIQGSIPQELKWQRKYREKTYEVYSKLSEPFWASDLIVWPETAIPSSYQNATDFIEKIEAKKANSDTIFMSGIIYNDQGSYFNSILLIDKEHLFYDKHHLVPFGEYLPLSTISAPLFDYLKIPVSGFSSGEKHKKLLVTDKAIFGMSICYENAFSDEIRRAMPDANILINVSNDAWFKDSMAPHQHLQIARMRAMESGRYLLRATNNGISAIIDEKGKIVSKSPQFVAYALPATVKLFTGITPYGRYGNSLIIGLCFIMLIVFYILKRKNSNRSIL